MLNNKGPRIVPWGIPNLSSLYVDPTLVLWFFLLNSYIEILMNILKTIGS